MPKITPAELSYNFVLTGNTGSKYIDIAQCASMVNRRLYRQGKNYYVASVEFIASAGGMCSMMTIPDTWVSANAWVKSYALWREMNKKVLSDNPSVEGKWADYKAFFDEAHVNGNWTSTGPTLNLKPMTGDVLLTGGVACRDGEWFMSTLVLPQHNVNTGTGAPLAADEFVVHMLGDDVAGAGAPDLIKSGAIIHAYADTRARVQEEPDVPGDMSLSWMTLLTDDGSQEPELADLIEGINDLPPYDKENYPGGDINYNDGVTQAGFATTATFVVDKAQGFKVPLGLIKVNWAIGGGTAVIKLNLMPGTYKGLLATEVQQ